MRKRKLANQITSFGLAFVMAMGGLSNMTFAATASTDSTQIVSDVLQGTSATETIDYDELNDEIYGNIGDYPVGNVEDFGEIIKDAIIVENVDDYNELIIDDIPQILQDDFPSAEIESTIPSVVDNSTNENAIYLPPVLSQYGGSCTCYSYIYAMGSYTLNKARGTSAQDTNNVINPLFSYNTSRGTLSGGASPKNAVTLLKEIGVPTAEYAPITNKYENYSYTWYPTEEIWNSATDNRIEEIINLQDISHTGTPVTSVDDTDLDLIKSTLASGKIIGFSTYFYTFNYTVIPEDSPSHAGEHAVDRCDYYRKNSSGGRSVGGHAMALVGYDDNIWIDVNRDGQKQTGEFGALKIMNSHGTGYKNKGFVWIAYDAINKVSSVITDADVERVNAAIDAKTMTGNKIQNEYRYEFFAYKNYLYTLSASGEAKTSSGCRLVATLNTTNRQDAKMEIIATKVGTTTKYTYNVPMFSSFGKWSKQYALDGSQSATDGTIVIDLDNVVSDITPATMDDYTWSVTIKDNTSESVPLNINDLHIKVDGVKKYNADLTTSSLNGTSATYNLEEYVPGNITTIYYANSSFSNAYIHYRINNGTWTSVPGKKMATSSEQSGYTWKYEIDLGKATLLEMCFNDGNNSWDSKNETNYSVGVGTFGIKDGTISEINVNKELAVTVSSDKSTGVVDTTTTFTATATGGKAPYTYQFAMVEAGKTPTSSSYTTASTKNTYGFSTSATGSYTLYVKVEDAEGKTVETTRTYKVVANNVINNTKATIYYSNSSWSQAYIHYKVGSGSWTTVPGVKMSANTSNNGYTWKYEIDLGTSSSLTVCFNNGSGSWDNNGSDDYSILKAGSFGIESGNVVELEEETVLQLDKSEAEMYVGDKVTVNASIWPLEAQNLELTWTSSNGAVATVVDGVITGISAGTATITATLADGTTATVNVTVSIDNTLSGLCKASDGNWYYYTKGVVDTSYTGLAKNAYGWWYVNNGKVDFSYTGMATNSKGTWYMNKGKLDTTVTGFVNTNIGWIYLTKGKLDTTYTGMVHNKYGWWYVKEGKLDRTYTGMATNVKGTWYMNKGKLDTTVTGLVKTNMGWIYLTNGKLDTTYTGMVTNKYGTWYVNKGKLDTSYTGKATYDGVTYSVVKGKVVN